MSFPPLSYRRGNWHPDEGALVSTSTKEDILAEVSTPGEIRPVWVADAHYTAVCGRACLSLWRSNESPAVRLRSDAAGQPRTDLESHGDLKRTLLLPIYLSLCQSKTLNAQRFPCSCVGNMQMTSHPCSPLPLGNYIPKNWKCKMDPQAFVSTQWDVLLIGDMHECISMHPNSPGCHGSPLPAALVTVIELL